MHCAMDVQRKGREKLVWFCLIHSVRQETSTHQGLDGLAAGIESEENVALGCTD